MKRILTLLAVATLTIMDVATLPALARQTKPTYLLHSERKPAQIDRVELLLEVGGEVLDSVDGKLQREKMSVVCQLGYDEKTLDVPTAAANRWRSLRYYDKATAVLKVGNDGIKPTLREERRLVGAEFDAETAILFSPEGTLTRKELDLIDVLGNSLLFDHFLPETPVAVGENWKHPAELLGALLGLDRVAESDVQSTLTDVTDASARIQMTGRVEGAINGVSTEIEIKAKYRFDRKRHRIDWFGLLVKEQRNSSPVTDGVDAVARVQVTISAKRESAKLSRKALEDVSLEPTARLCRLHYESPDGGWQLAHDRRWFVTGARHDLTVFRLMDRGEYIAQCKVSPLRNSAAGKQITLSEFQADVRRALGENFGEFAEAAQGENDAKERVYRVVARGSVSQLPIQWNHYLVADEHGRQVALSFSVEDALVEQFDEADRKLVESLRFLDSKLASNSGK